MAKRPAPAEPGSGSSDEEGDEDEAPSGAEDAAAGAAGAEGEARSSAGGRPGSGAAQGRRKKSQVVLSDGRVVSTKVRNHVNPLLPHFQKPVPVPAGGDWGQVFRDPLKPLTLDLGSAKGRFCLEGARRFPEFNWLGVEIREPLVVRANEWRKEENLPNLHYIFGNVSAGLAELLASLPGGVLQRVTIQCPDPCFKKKHQKRRMVTGRLVAELAAGMPAGSVLFVQSDVAQVAMQMVDTIAATGGFERVDRLPSSAATASGGEEPIEPIRRPHPTRGQDFQDKDVGGGDWEHKGAGAVDGSYNWLAENPLGLMSERESSTISRGLPVFRALFVRCSPSATAAVASEPAAAAATGVAEGAAEAASAPAPAPAG